MATRKGDAGRPGIPANPTEDWKPHEVYVRLNITLDPELDNRLERFCHEEERAKSWVIRKALESYLNGKGY